jgi:hypothetical protein
MISIYSLNYKFPVLQVLETKNSENTYSVLCYVDDEI